MNIVKRLAYNCAIPLLGRCFVGRNHYINVIYYHDIVKGVGKSYMQTNIDVFKRQLRYLADNDYLTYRFDDLEDEHNLLFGRKKVLITFDDGWRSNYSEIIDFMKSRGLKYNVFLTVGEINKNPEYLSWNQIRQMHETGLVGFGVHTYNHPHIEDMSGIDPELEFVKANEVFLKELGYEAVDFCYPFGSCSERSHEYLTTQTKYKRIYTSSMMYSYRKNERIVFGRNGISNDDSSGVFKAKVKGYFNIWTLLVK